MSRELRVTTEVPGVGVDGDNHEDATGSHGTSMRPASSAPATPGASFDDAGGGVPDVGAADAQVRREERNGEHRDARAVDERANEVVGTARREHVGGDDGRREERHRRRRIGRLLHDDGNLTGDAPPTAERLGRRRGRAAPARGTPSATGPSTGSVFRRTCRSLPSGGQWLASSERTLSRSASSVSVYSEVDGWSSGQVLPGDVLVGAVLRWQAEHLLGEDVEQDLEVPPSIELPLARR